MKIAMIGTGYVGLVSGVCFSDFGHQVVCVDKSVEKLAKLQAGQVPIYEPGLDVVMARNVAAGRLSFTSDIAAAVDGAELQPGTCRQTLPELVGGMKMLAMTMLARCNLRSFGVRQ